MHDIMQSSTRNQPHTTQRRTAMTEYQETTEMKKIAQRELNRYFGFAPKLNQIVLLECGTDTLGIDYVGFNVNNHGYRWTRRNGFETYKAFDTED